MSELYNRIDRLCKERGTNITALCRDSYVARSSLSELNAGRTKTLTLDTAGKLAATLGVSVDELMGVEQKEKPTPSEGSELKGIYFNLAKEAQDSEIDPDDIKAAIEIIKKLKNK